MRYCERCGVEYDSPGDWCADCLEVEGTENVWGLSGYRAALPEVMEQKAQDIKDLWLNAWTDKQIAAYLGIAERTVVRWRQRLKLPATNHGGHWLMSPLNQEKNVTRITAYAAQPGWGYAGNKRAKELGVGWFKNKSGNSTHGISEDTKR